MDQAAVKARSPPLVRSRRASASASASASPSRNPPPAARAPPHSWLTRRRRNVRARGGEAGPGSGTPPGGIIGCCIGPGRGGPLLARSLAAAVAAGLLLLAGSPADPELWTPQPGPPMARGGGRGMGRPPAAIADLATLGYRSRPWQLRYLPRKGAGPWPGAEAEVQIWSVRTEEEEWKAAVSPNRTVEPMSEEPLWSELSEEARDKISRKYTKGRKDDGVSPPCVHREPWQAGSKPTCNVVHEADVGNVGLVASPRLNQRIANGGWVEIWKVYGPGREDGTADDPVVLKTKLYHHDFTPRNMDRYRRDAIVLERLTFSPHVLDIYGYCGVTDIIPYYDGGDLGTAIERRGDGWPPRKKAEIAFQVMRSLADAHNADGATPSIAHTDITSDQFLNRGDDTFVLNDFNRARFVGMNETDGGQCPFYVGKNPGGWRSPEEYRYDGETEKVDVYSAGNTLYFLLTGDEPFDHLSVDVRVEKVMEGKRPHISHRKYRHSEDPLIQAIVDAIDMCWIHDPKVRAAARVVAGHLQEALEREGGGQYQPSI